MTGRAESGWEAMIRFGTGGWRGTIGEDFTKSNVRLISAALARKMKGEGRAEKGLVIGYGRRPLSKEAARWAAEVFAGEGVFCRVVGRESPAPLAMFAVELYGLPCGLMVTAGHNPASCNGVRVFMEGGRDADEALTGELERVIAETEPESIASVPFSLGIERGLIRIVDPTDQYIGSILRSIDTEAVRGRSPKIALGPMSQDGRAALRTILLTARCQVDAVGGRGELFCGQTPAPGPAALSGLADRVKGHGCDFGIALDGDSGRLAVIDDRAEYLHPNKILTLLYYYLMKYRGRCGAAVRSIATTHLTDRIAEEFGETCYEVPVGFRSVSSKMAETNAIIGGESSGGLAVRGHLLGRDGIHAAALLAETVAVTGRSLSELYGDVAARYGPCESDESDFFLSPQEKARISATLFEDKLLPEFPLKIEKVSYIDGCKVYFRNGGWVLARFSGTGPLLRVCCEMPTLAEAVEIRNVMRRFLSLPLSAGPRVPGVL